MESTGFLTPLKLFLVASRIAAAWGWGVLKGRWDMRLSSNWRGPNRGCLYYRQSFVPGDNQIGNWVPMVIFEMCFYDIFHEDESHVL